jgi:hypothetical protein
MKLRIPSIIILTLFILLNLSGCKKEQSTLIIKEIGPTKTKAGQGFNVQPEGMSALWVIAENVTDTTFIVWDGKLLKSFKAPYGISAPVPEEHYAKPGSYQIYLLDTKTFAKSNSLVFIVEE